MSKEHNIPNHYYKDLESGIEMLFRFDTRYGWSVSFVNEDSIEVHKYFHIDFPKTPEKYKAQIDEFYINLEKKYQQWSKE